MISIYIPFKVKLKKPTYIRCGFCGNAHVTARGCMAVAFDVYSDGGLTAAVCTPSAAPTSTTFQLLFMHKNQSYDELTGNGTIPHIVVDTRNNTLAVMVWSTCGVRDVVQRFRLIFSPEAVAFSNVLDTDPLNFTFDLKLVDPNNADLHWQGSPDRSGVYVDPNHSSACTCQSGCRCIKGAERLVERAGRHAADAGSYVISAAYAADERRRHGYLQQHRNMLWDGTMTAGNNSVVLEKVSSAHEFTVKYQMLPNQTILQWFKPDNPSKLVNQWLKSAPLYVAPSYVDRVLVYKVW